MKEHQCLRSDQRVPVPLQMPDPGKYDIPPSIGRQTLSTKESASPKSFVKAIRNVKVSIGKGFEEDMYGLDAPGPGTYPTKSGFGTQARGRTRLFDRRT